MVIFISAVKIIILAIVTYLFCKIVTNNKKRLIITGTFLIVCSTAIVQYLNLGLVETLIFGELFLIFLNKFLFYEKNKYLYSVGIVLCIIGYFLCSNLSFQISIGITIVAMAIWLITKYFMTFKKIDNKISKKNIGVLICLAIISIIIIFIFYRYNILESMENISGLSYVVNYSYSIMLPFNHNIKFENITCLATMISVFPISLFISIIYIFKYDDKHMEFFIPTILIALIEMILLGLGKISNIVPNYIMAISFALIQIYMMIYIFANVEEKLFKIKTSAYIAILGVVLFYIFPMPKEIRENKLQDIPYMIFVLESMILLNYTDRRFWKLFSWIFILFTVIETVGFIIVKVV